LLVWLLVLSHFCESEMLPGRFVWCRVQLSRAQIVVRGGELKVASLRVPLTLDWSLGLATGFLALPYKATADLRVIKAKERAAAILSI
jgi:hypothetical protein